MSEFELIITILVTLTFAITLLDILIGGRKS